MTEYRDAAREYLEIAVLKLTFHSNARPGRLTELVHRAVPYPVLVDKDGEERLYFVVETKSTLFTDDLRYKEGAKIKCGDVHFKALAVGDNPARFIVARKVDDMLTHE